MRIVINFTGTEEELDVLTPRRMAYLMRTLNAATEQVTPEFDIRVEDMDVEDEDDMLTVFADLHTMGGVRLTTGERVTLTS